MITVRISVVQYKKSVEVYAKEGASGLGRVVVCHRVKLVDCAAVEFVISEVVGRGFHFVLDGSAADCLSHLDFCSCSKCTGVG